MDVSSIVGVDTHLLDRAVADPIATFSCPATSTQTRRHGVPVAYVKDLTELVGHAELCVESATEELVRRYHERIHGLIYSMVGHKRVIADLRRTVKKLTMLLILLVASCLLGYVLRSILTKQELHQKQRKPHPTRAMEWCTFVSSLI
jgi:hypothetical protein